MTGKTITWWSSISKPLRLSHCSVTIHLFSLHISIMTWALGQTILLLGVCLGSWGLFIAFCVDFDFVFVLLERKGPNFPPLRQNLVTGRRLPKVEVIFLSAKLPFSFVLLMGLTLPPGLSSLLFHWRGLLHNLPTETDPDSFNVSWWLCGWRCAPYKTWLWAYSISRFLPIFLVSLSLLWPVK